jgi:hypothetical protein
MTVTIHNLRRVSVYEEPNGSFAVDHSGTAGDFLAVPAATEGLAFTTPTDMLDPGTLQQYKHGRALQVVGPRQGATLTMKVPLFLTGTIANATTTSLTHTDSGALLLLEMFFGGARDNVRGSVASSVSSSSVFTVAAGVGSRFAAGGCVGWVNAAGTMELREIEGVSTDTVTLKHAFSASPSVGNAIYSGITLYPATKASPTTLQFLVEGEEADDYWCLLGCMPQSATLDLTWGQIPSVTYEFYVTDWDYLGSGSLAGQTYSNYNPLAYNSGELLVQTVATATRNIVSHRSFAFTTTLTYTPIPSPEGVQGRIGFVQAHTPPVATCVIGTYYEDQTWHTDRTSRNKKHVALQMGESASGGVLLTMPTAQVVEIGAPTDGDGLTGSDVTLAAMLDEDTGAQTSALLRAPMRLHIVG